jgi:hypothetical protein
MILPSSLDRSTMQLIHYKLDRQRSGIGRGFNYNRFAMRTIGSDSSWLKGTSKFSRAL